MIRLFIGWLELLQVINFVILFYQFFPSWYLANKTYNFIDHLNYSTFCHRYIKFTTIKAKDGLLFCWRHEEVSLVEISF